MADQLTGFEMYPRGGSDFWDTPAGAIAVKEILPITSPSLTPRRALILIAGQMQEVPTAMLGTGKLPIVLMSDGTVRERQTTEGTPLVLVSGVLRQILSSESLQV